MANLTDISDMPPFTTFKVFELHQESELRLEVGFDSSVRIQVLDGSAEIFGTELPPRLWITFPAGRKFAVFTWSGAKVEVQGTPEVGYVADETPMVSYINVHTILEGRRARAQDAAVQMMLPSARRADSLDQPQGPRAIVVGPTDSGKTSLSKMLLGWAAKHRWKPTYVDLDIGQGYVTIPGTLAATPVDMPIDPVEGIALEVPVVYFYGHTTPSVNVDLYKVLVKELARTLEVQFAGNHEARAAGMVINTMGWIEGVGYELLLHAIETFKTDVILVLGQEKLYSMLQDKFKGKAGIDIVKLHKSGGVVARSSKFRQQTRTLRTREYFYGMSNELSPHTASASFSEVQIFRIGGLQASASALPIGTDPTVDPTCPVRVTISHDLVHSVLAVSYAREPEQLLSSNVAGFIYVTDVDVPRRKLSYVAPCPGPLPNNILLAGSLSWVE